MSITAQGRGPERNPQSAGPRRTMQELRTWPTGSSATPCAPPWNRSDGGDVAVAKTLDRTHDGPNPWGSGGASRGGLAFGGVRGWGVRSRWRRKP